MQNEAQHAKTLAWADARKVKCPCRRVVSTPPGAWGWSAIAAKNCPLCLGSGEVTWGDMVKEAGV